MPGLRVPHILRKNASGAAPQSWVVLAVETTPVRLERAQWQQVFRVATATHWRPARESKRETVLTRTFTDASDLVAYLANIPKSRERLGIVAYNFDFASQVLDMHTGLRAEGYGPTRLIIEKGKWSQRWQRGSRRSGKGSSALVLIDLCNWYSMSLSELAAYVGIVKLRRPAAIDSDAAWQRYTEHCAEISLAALRAWLKFRDDHDLGYFAPTIAGQALNAYRHRFMNHPIYIHTHADVLALEQAAYIGGRNECFWRGRAPRRKWVQLDATSFYASVQYGNTFPTRQVGHYWNVGIDRLRELTERQLVIARVELETDVPAFPYRTETGTVYPVGRFKATLATPEIRLALSGHCIKRCLEVVTYDHELIFDDYIAFFWQLRQDAKARRDAYTGELAKRMLVSLYGKFGQRIWLSNILQLGLDQPDKIWTEYDLPNSRWYEYRIIAGRLEQRSRELTSRDSLVAIPAHVCSYGRSRLFELMLLAGLDSVMYVDTDSLIVAEESLSAFSEQLVPNQLGALRVVSQSDHLYIRAPKWYAIGNKQRHGGVRELAEKLDGDRFRQDSYRSMKWALGHDRPGAAIVDEVIISAPWRGALLAHSLGHRLNPIKVP